MLLNFQKQFAFPVYNGEKRQTIRSAGKRRDVPAIGGTAHCYTGLRTSKTQRLGSWPIAQVDVIRMDIGASAIANVIVAGDRLTRLQLTALAGKDGFRSWEDMERWFIQAHGPQEFYGWVVGWTWSPSDAPVPEIKR
jgi:hypothetical protein